MFYGCTRTFSGLFYVRLSSPDQDRARGRDREVRMKEEMKTLSHVFSPSCKGGDWVNGCPRVVG